MKLLSTARGLRLAATAAVLVAGSFPVSAQSVVPPEFSTVFEHGHDGYPDYRIPSLLTTQHGVLLAFAEGRQTLSDHSENAIVLKRSTDGGHSWGPVQVVHTDRPNLLVNPCAVALESGRVLLMYQWFGASFHSRPIGQTVKRLHPGITGNQVSHTLLRWSDDDGATWSEARDVTAQTKRDGIITSTASGPGIGIQLQHGPHCGRILIPTGESWGTDQELTNNVYACISDDGGATWHYGQAVPGNAGLGTECQLVELPDGSVLLNDRSADQGHQRKTALSHDGGETWSSPHDEAQLPESKCMGSILRYSWPVDGTSRILFANPAVTQGRSHGTVRLSLDEGRSWAVSKTIWPGSYAYSCLARLPSGEIGLLLEVDGCKEIKFARFSLAWLTDGGSALPFNPEAEKLIQTDRPDGRYLSTRGYVQYLMRHAQPQLAFNPKFTPAEMQQWQTQVRAKMAELLRFPDGPHQPPPQRVSQTKRQGYTVEKWELYPVPGSVVPFLMLVPDSASAGSPAPAVLCYPGSDNTKENLAGEPELNPTYVTRHHPDLNRMAMFYARQGMVAVAIDNPGIAETSDVGAYVVPNNDRDTFSRYLIDLGWSYIGFSAFNGHQILKWLRGLDFVDGNRLALSGHSLGTEPVMSLALVEPDLKAVVFNDFLNRNINRSLSMTKPNSAGVRPQANGLNHSIPGMWQWFDYPDQLAALAPLPLAITEGGAASDLDVVKNAYRLVGADGALLIHHYDKYRDPKNRRDYATIPEGLDRDEYFRYVNVDAPNHAFEVATAVPWLSHILKAPGPAQR